MKTKDSRIPHPARWCYDDSHSVPVRAWSWCLRRCLAAPPGGTPRASSAGGRRPATRPRRSRRRPRSSQPSRRASRAPPAGDQGREGGSLISFVLWLSFIVRKGVMREVGLLSFFLFFFSMWIYKEGWVWGGKYLRGGGWDWRGRRVHLKDFYRTHRDKLEKRPSVIWKWYQIHSKMMTNQVYKYMKKEKTFATISFLFFSLRKN